VANRPLWCNPPRLRPCGFFKIVSDDQVPPMNESISAISLASKRRFNRVVPVQDSMRVSSQNSGCTSLAPVNRRLTTSGSPLRTKSSVSVGRCSCTCSPGHQPSHKSQPVGDRYRRLPALQSARAVIFSEQHHAAKVAVQRQTKPGAGVNYNGRRCALRLATAGAFTARC